MPSDGNGVYSLPPGYLAITGDTIVISQHNPIFEDVRDALTDRLMRSGVAAMTGPLKLADGTAGAPSLTFASAPTFGFYKSTAGIGVSSSGTQIADLGANGVVFVDGGDLASASALAVNAAGNIFNVTGTTSITSLATKGVGTVVFLHFAASLTLTHHATDLILSRNANITTAAGDWAILEEYASGDWRLISYFKFDGTALAASVPRGYIDGCTLSNNGSDTTNDINIAAGVCRDSTNTVNINVAAMTGKQLDANWVAGGSAGMRNSGVSISDATWHIFAVAKADGTQDIFADSTASQSSALTNLQGQTGGSGYIYIRRIGSIIRESSTIVQFIQDGDTFYRSNIAGDIGATDPGTSAVTRTLSVPSGLAVDVLVYAAVKNAGSGGQAYCLLTALTAPDTTPSDSITMNATAATATGGAVSAGFAARVRTNTSRQIRSRVSYSDGNVTLVINTYGWVDSRGKNA